MPGHTKRSVKSFWVERMPGCERLCRLAKTVGRNEEGIYGHGVEVVTSQRIVPDENGRGKSCKQREEEARSDVNSGSLC